MTGPRSTRRLHAATIAVIVAGVIVVGGAAIVAEVVHRDTEQRLLDQRTGEAGAVLATAISGLQTPLASAAELAEVTNGDQAALRARCMARLDRHRPGQAVRLGVACTPSTRPSRSSPWASRR